MPATALIYDVHGNLPALEAVLGDARSLGAKRFLLGGDYALFGPWPAETLVALRELTEATWIRGNVDRWTAYPEHVIDEHGLQVAIAACREALGEEPADELGTLQEHVTIGDMLYCHASPVSDMRSFLPEPQADEDQLLGDIGAARRIVFGHTHLQFRRTRDDGLELVNPGSVGMPLDGDHRAAYALVYDGGRLEQRRVAYDHEASARAVTERFGDAEWAARSHRRLLTARP